MQQAKAKLDPLTLRNQVDWVEPATNLEGRPA
jgi:hypothetical protein